MKLRNLLILASFALATLSTNVLAAEPDTTVVRVADLVIDPTQLDAYTAAVKEEMAASVKVEPGVLAIYAVAEKDDPTHLRFLEIYTNEQAYLDHRESPHFKKYLAITGPMITSRKLVEAVPVQLSAKNPLN
jgi:quinol monooxygenase YgiN